MNMKKSYIILYIIMFGTVSGKIINPSNNDSLNYKQILFEWEQERDALKYNLQIMNVEEESIVVDIMDSTLIAIISDNLDFGNEYMARLRVEYLNNEYSEFLDSIYFTINELSEYFINNLNTVEIEIIDTSEENWFSFQNGHIIDKYGDVILFFPFEDKFMLTSQLSNGDMLGLSSLSPPLQGGNILKLNGEIVWNTPVNYVHHDIIALPNGNYMGLVNETFTAPIHSTWQSDLENFGIESVEWRGDIIVEWDEAGNEIWNWKTSEHYSLLDIGEVSYGINQINNGISYDWTHCNAIFFDTTESAIYLSARNLSRITKIDYPSGNIIWNMGKDMVSGDIDFGTSLGFSFQHAIKLLDNRNLMLFDNGNYNDPPTSRGLEVSVNENNNSFSSEIVWEYSLTENMSTLSKGDCDRLDNGNSIMTCGNSGFIIEVNELDSVIWLANSSAPLYRSERLESLYPLAFHIKIPNFSGNIESPTIYVPEDSTDFEFTIYNEGHKKHDFSYSISDSLEWFNETGLISIEPNQKLINSISGFVTSDSVSNPISLTVCPVSIYDVQCKSLIIEVLSCPTFQSTIECLDCPSIVGDYNNDDIADILDIILLVNMILSNQYNVCNDINSDEVIDVLDIILLVNIILN